MPNISVPIEGKFDEAKNNGEKGIEDLRTRYNFYKTRLEMLKKRVNNLLELKNKELVLAKREKINLSNPIGSKLDKAKETITRGGADSLKMLADFHGNMDQVSNIKSRIIEIESKMKTLFDPANKDSGLFDLLLEEFDNDITKMEEIVNFMEMDMGYGQYKFEQFDIQDIANVHAGYDIIENHNKEARNKGENTVSLDSLIGENIPFKQINKIPGIPGREVIPSR